jgi:hypothetical protein
LVRPAAFHRHYSKTSLLGRKERDEIREVSPGTYLGMIFYGEVKSINFALDFLQPHRDPA